MCLDAFFVSYFFFSFLLFAFIGSAFTGNWLVTGWGYFLHEHFVMSHCRIVLGLTKAHEK